MSTDRTAPQLLMSTLRRSLALVVLALVAVLGACDGNSSGPDRSPLAGLSEASSNDSTGTSVPSAPVGPILPGYFRGTVLGAPLPGSGPDTLSTMPRIAGATVTAYPVMSGLGDARVLGTAAASASTDAMGKFTLPTVPHGEYVLTVVPPANGAFGGVFVTGYAYPGSHEFALWIILPRR